jgi:hypothetical protein
MNLSEVIIGDMINFTIPISGLDLTGKTLKMQWSEAWDQTPALTFQESDGTLTKSLVQGENTTNITLYQTSATMANIKKGTYNIALTMFTGANDIQTIIKGTAKVDYRL